VVFLEIKYIRLTTFKILMKPIKSLKQALEDKKKEEKKLREKIRKKYSTLQVINGRISQSN